jgi:glycerol uptake facilitator-like aquaporin
MLNLAWAAVFGVGMSYAVGLGLGLVVAAPSTPPHFSPSITLVRVLFDGFPLTKAFRCVPVTDVSTIIVLSMMAARLAPPTACTRTTTRPSA